MVSPDKKHANLSYVGHFQIHVSASGDEMEMNANMAGVVVSRYSMEKFETSYSDKTAESGPDKLQAEFEKTGGRAFILSKKMLMKYMFKWGLTGNSHGNLQCAVNIE